MRDKRLSIRVRAVLAIVTVALFVRATRATAQETVLHNFGGTDGVQPYAGLIFDASGNLYGTTLNGGVHGLGTVFELTLTAGGGWTETVLHNFNHNGRDGYNPHYAGLIFDASGNLYGTTYYGGVLNYGTVFELTPTAGGVGPRRCCITSTSTAWTGSIPKPD
jgi:uncharacterized repeat protein (TIGR03803 family)